MEVDRSAPEKIGLEHVLFGNDYAEHRYNIVPASIVTDELNTVALMSQMCFELDGSFCDWDFLHETVLFKLKLTIDGTVLIDKWFNHLYYLWFNRGKYKEGENNG